MFFCIFSVDVSIFYAGVLLVSAFFLFFCRFSQLVFRCSVDFFSYFMYLLQILGISCVFLVLRFSKMGSTRKMDSMRGFLFQSTSHDFEPSSKVWQNRYMIQSSVKNQSYIKIICFLKYLENFNPQ